MIKTVIFDIDDTLYDATLCYEYGAEAVARYTHRIYGIKEDAFFHISKKRRTL